MPEHGLSGTVPEMGAATERGAELNRQFVRGGYCHIPAAVSADLIERVRAFVDAATDGVSDEE